MTHVMAGVLAVVLGAILDVPAGAPVADALRRARAGDVVRLGPGLHRASLGRLAGVAVEGAGAGVTEVEAPEGDDGAVAAGEVSLSALSLRAGPARCALKVLGGTARLANVVLSGGSCGAFVDGGRLAGTEVALLGGYGLLARRGEVELEGGWARGTIAGVAILGGRVSLARFDVVGPSREAGISVAGGAASLSAVAIRTPGPSGIALSGGAALEGRDVAIAGATEDRGILGDCVQVARATVRLESSLLARCGGAALEASGGSVRLLGVDAAGGSAGCVVLLDGADADREGNVCTGHGPSLVAASGSKARARMNAWRADPALWVDCGSGARVAIGPGERVREPCKGGR